MDTRVSEPAVVYVKDEPKFIARPGCIGRQNAVQITEQIDPRDEIVYKNLSKPITID